MEKIALYCKSYIGDIERTKILYESILQHNKENIKFYISVPSQDIAQFRNRLGNYGYELIEDEYILNTAWQSPWLKTLRLFNHGWYNQQVVKSSFWKLNLAENYLCIDSDSYFIKDFRLSDFMVDENTIYQTAYQAKDFWLYLDSSGKQAEKKFYFSTARKIYDFFEHQYVFPLSFGPTPVVWSNKVWQTLEEKYLLPKNIDFVDLINLAPFELNWYGECLLKEKPINYIATESFFKCYHYSDIYKKDIDNGITEEMIAQNYLGIVMQSNWNPPLKFVNPNLSSNLNNIAQPLVSIGMPVYNGEKYLSQALDSLLAQDHINFELIICDNNSTDKTSEICQFYADQDNRIRLYKNETNIGASANFKKVFQLSKGQYFMWAAYDDRWHINYISKCLKKLQENETAILCSSEITFINEDNSIRDNWTQSYSNIDTLGMSIPQRVHQLINRLGWYSYYGLIKSKYLKQIENELDDSRYGADVIISLKLMLLGDLTKVPERLFYYRVSNQEKTAEQHITQMANPASIKEVPAQPYSFLAKELLHICLNSSLISDYDKKLIKKDFLKTLATENWDWLNKIACEQSWQIPKLPMSTQSIILRQLMSKVLEISDEDSEIKDKNALIFFPHNPYPAKTGAHQRCLSLIKALQAWGYNITLCGWNIITDHHYPQDTAALKTIESALNVKVLVYQGTAEDYQFIQSVQLQNNSDPFAIYTPRGLKQFFEQIFDQISPQLVVINYALWGELINKNKFRNAVTVLEAHDLFTLNTQMQNSLQNYLSSPPYHPDHIDLELVKENFYSKQNLQPALREYQIFDQYDYTLVMSPQEASQIANHTQNTQIIYLPMTYAPVNVSNTYQEKPIFAVGPNRFNIQGYLYFTKQVLPKILAIIPDFKLEVIGMICEELAAVNGIQLSGFVPDLTTIYTHSSFAICPLIGGTGQQVKIVEAMAHGLPVIALRNVAETSPIDHGVNGFIANNADEFAEYTIQLWQDRKLCERLGIAARKTIADKFSPQVIKDKLAIIINASDLKSSITLQFPSRCQPQIIIDAIFFQLYKTGIARVWKSLLEQWANTEFANHILVLDRANTAPKINGIRYRTIPFYNVHNLEEDRQMLQEICNEEGADLLISTYYTIPINTPSVLMVHDMIPEIFEADLNHPNWRGKTAAINYASHYICVSENSAKDLQKFYPQILNSNITIAYNGVSDCFQTATIAEIQQFQYSYGINKPYFLLGGLGGYKNAILFLQAFSQLSNKHSFDIVATGAGNQLPSEWRQYTAGCTFHGLQLSDAELRLAYAGAVALVYPSQYEGFGMPVAEAMACGCPVITTPNASLPEVGGEAVIYVKDDDIEGMANALCEVQKPSLRRNLISAGLTQSQKFSWSKMADIISDVLINQTLESLPFNLQEINLIMFPDWTQSEDDLYGQIGEIIKVIATDSHADKTTLLIDVSNTDAETADLILSSIAMNLMMEDEIDITERMQISLIEEISEKQLQKLLPHLHSRIVLAVENQQAITRFQGEKLPALEIGD